MTTLEITAADRRRIYVPVVDDRRRYPAIVCPTCREAVPLTDGFGQVGSKEFYCSNGHRFGQLWAAQALHDIATGR